MRTTIEIPEALLDRAKPILAERRMTLRALVIDALERFIEPGEGTFQLRDASAGCRVTSQDVVTTDAINHALDELREASS